MLDFIYLIINNGLAVFLSVLAFLGVCGIGVLLYFLIKRERAIYHYEVSNYIDGVENKREIVASINAYISKSVNQEFSLLYIDLDKFSSVVENFGKDEANNIIRAIATKVLTVLPVRVSLGRLDEDKFLVFVRGEYSKEDTLKLARTILEMVNSPIKLYADAQLQLTCSIGIAFYPQHGRTYKQLEESLEIACYVCKRDGGNKYRIYTEEENQSTNMEYYYQIKEGIKHHEFDLYFQPMINDETKDIYAIEGLLRWNHPELGVLSPYKFISIMEQTGDINWVGLWGLETLIKDFVRIRKTYPRDFKMSLNLSPKQLTNESLAADFARLVKKYHIQARSIILEIEEFSIFEKQETIKDNLQKLSDMGFDIAVDGFGLDYKALKKLEDSHVNVLKLDREFLKDMTGEMLKNKFVEILVDFANTNHCSLVCEGVEDFSYLQRARAMGCSLYQGYYFSKPLNRDELDLFLERKDWVEKLEKQPAKDQVEEPKLSEDDRDDFIDADLSGGDNAEAAVEEEKPAEEANADSALEEEKPAEESTEKKEE